MKSPRRTTLAWAFAIAIGAAMSSLAAGCAGVKNPGSGGGGTGGSFVQPPIEGLLSLEVTPSSQPVMLTQSPAGLTGTATFAAIGHMKDGSTMDVTSRVGWPSSFRSLRVASGVATVTAPGTYTITAASGSVMATAQLIASFTGNFFAPGFDPTGAAPLDGNPTAAAVSIAYPLTGSVFPSNLSPVQVHISRASASYSAARLNFSADGVNVNYYGACQAAVGTGCYVDLPLDITQLFIAVSETHDIALTARVAGLGAPLAESAPINVAWANVPLSGGLYYWATTVDGIVPGYISPRDTAGQPAPGTGVLRYDFGVDGARPQLIYTDKGPPPSFLGSPPADSSGAQCIGCHAITNDGKTMALTIGGSSSQAPDAIASNFALLDLTTLKLTVLDAAAAGGSTSPTDINYYKQFRKAGIATETTFGPNGDVMVNMFRSQLILHGTNATLANQGAVVPSFAGYKTDPFWSQSGKFFVFTSFATPDIGTYNSTGLNGDMKRNGGIAIATGEDTMVHDDASVLVAAETNVTKYYPAISNDDKYVVYNQSTCGADPDVYTNTASNPQVGVYGSQRCDGYDDSSAQLWLTTTTKAFPIILKNANGDGAFDNSWPRWSPDNGMFRGQRLYWLAFSSRRPYGLQVNVNQSAPLTTRPQLWFAAVLSGDEFANDPSFRPVWLPNQNPMPTGRALNEVANGNHVPQWVKVAVVIPG
jgi:hypothetical protein